MAEAPQQFSVNDVVSEALVFTRTQSRFIAMTTAIGVAALITALLLQLALGPLAGVLAFVVQAVVYTAFLCVALGQAPGAVRSGLVAASARVFAALGVVVSFLFFVLFVAMIPGVTVLGMVALGPFEEQLAAAATDQTATMTILTQAMETNPLPFLLFFLAYVALWLLLTSRLYLAAPASAERGRILSFETWRWTKGAMLHIAGARLMLLAPAYVLVMAVAVLMARLVGIGDVFAAGTTAPNVPALVLYLAVLNALNLGLYLSLEAGLSAAIYRRLAPPAA
ncbi:MAG: hypothetical protein R3C16_07080 [Hyphomonadaceae bacterium]